MEEEYFRVPSPKGDIKIPFRFITRFEANGRYIIIHTVGEQEILHCMSLGEAQEQIKYRKNFFRINNSNIINVEYIVNVRLHHATPFVYMHPWTAVLISRSKLKSIENIARKRKIRCERFPMKNYQPLQSY